MTDSRLQVFIDTNIYLSFYLQTRDQLDILDKVFSSHTHGSTSVYITLQVKKEFYRNREAKIKEALKRFNEANPRVSLPVFMRDYKEYEEIKVLSRQLSEKIALVNELVRKDVYNHALTADKMIFDIIHQRKLIKGDFYEDAVRRVRLGDPPRKKDSIGDAINWLSMLSVVPDQCDLHIISDDGDFFSDLRDDMPHPSLVTEWRDNKHADLFVYRSISKFMNERFPNYHFPYDKVKWELINALKISTTTHYSRQMIGQLDDYLFFTQSETSEILDLAISNEYLSAIITDPLVASFIKKIAGVNFDRLTKPEHKILMRSITDGRGVLDPAPP